MILCTDVDGPQGIDSTESGKLLAFSFSIISRLMFEVLAEMSQQLLNFLEIWPTHCFLPNRQSKCWWCMFWKPQIWYHHLMLQLYISLGSIFNFMLWQRCAFWLMRLRNKSHLGIAGKISGFGLLSWGPVVSHLQILKHCLLLWLHHHPAHILIWKWQHVGSWTDQWFP